MSKPIILTILEAAEPAVRKQVADTPAHGSNHCVSLTCREVLEVLDYLAHVRALASAAQGGQDATQL